MTRSFILCVYGPCESATSPITPPKKDQNAGRGGDSPISPRRNHRYCHRTTTTVYSLIERREGSVLSPGEGDPIEVLA